MEKSAQPGRRIGTRAVGKRAGERVLSMLLLVALPAAAQEVGGELPQPLPLFPSENWWNLDISQAPADPQSDAYIAWIGGDSLHPDFGGDAPEQPEIYGMPYIVVPGSQPLEPVTFVLYGDESDAGAPGRPNGYPIPIEARTQPKWIEGGYPGDANVGGDRHMLIVDYDHRLLYELYQAHWNGDLERWEAGSGAVWPLDYSRRRPLGWTSADAAGLAILPGLVRYDEVFESDEPIRHAFRFTLRDSNGFVFPASHVAGGDPAAPPLGARLRLKASVDITGFPQPIRRIFQAMKTYGLILADNGSDMYIQGTYDTRWDNDLLNPAFAQLSADDFELVRLGWRPALFADVPTSYWARSAIEGMAFAAVTSGCASEPRRFCPAAPVRRREMAVFLLRVAEWGTYLPPVCPTPPFADVPVTSPFCRWIRELSARGITAGCGGGLFCPASPVTRAQMAVFLLATLEGPEYSPPPCESAPFDDVPVGSPTCPWIRELVERGLTAGCGGGDYCPGSPVTRAQMAVFLTKAFSIEGN